MSEFINNAEKKRNLLKDLILKMHRGENPEQVKAELRQVLGQIPYDDVIRVEQELIAGGLPQEEVVKLCDVHTAVLDGSIDRTGAKTPVPGHPVHTLGEENRALEREIAELEKLYRGIPGGTIEKTGTGQVLRPDTAFQQSHGRGQALQAEREPGFHLSGEAWHYRASRGHVGQA